MLSSYGGMLLDFDGAPAERSAGAIPYSGRTCEYQSMRVLLPIVATLMVQDAAPSYRPPEIRPKGTVVSCGSDVMNNVLTLMGEGIRKACPDVSLRIEGKGNVPMHPLLWTSDEVQIVPASHEASPADLEKFERKLGYRPQVVSLGWQDLAIVVHKDNPMEELTLAQVDAAFSKTRKRGHAAVTTWGDLGARGDWKERAILAIGRNSASGYYGFFKKFVLQAGDYLESMREMSGSASVVQAVQENLAAIGYSSSGFVKPGVRALRIKSGPDTAGVAPTPATVRDGAYPLARKLTIYVKNPPEKPLDPAVREFLLFALSKEGQELVERDGWISLAPAQSAAERAKIR